MIEHIILLVLTGICVVGSFVLGKNVGKSNAEKESLIDNDEFVKRALSARNAVDADIDGVRKKWKIEK